MQAPGLRAAAGGGAACRAAPQRALQCRAAPFAGGRLALTGARRLSSSSSSSSSSAAWRTVSLRDTVRGATTGSNGAAEPAPEGFGGAVGVKQAEPAAAADASAAADATPGVEAADAGARSHPLAITEDMFGTDELVAELTDASSLGKRGELYLVAQLLAAVFVIWPPFKLAGLFDLMATLALVSGLVFIAYGLISLGRAFSPLPAPRKNHKLVSTGLYAHVRHPVYGGLILAGLGLAAITRSEGRLALALLLWGVLEKKAAFEEAALIARYGSAYKELQERTKKFVPWLY